MQRERVEERIKPILVKLHKAYQDKLRRALSPTFRAGAMVFFIPWRVVAEESGAAHFGFGGAMRCSTCWPHDGEVAGGAVEISVLVNLVGGDDGAQAVGANDDRPMLMSASPGRGGGGSGGLS